MADSLIIELKNFKFIENLRKSQKISFKFTSTGTSLLKFCKCLYNGIEIHVKFKLFKGYTYNIF